MGKNPAFQPAMTTSVVAQGCGLAAPVAAAVQGRGSAAPGAAAARWLLSAAVARDLHGGEVARRRLGEEQQKRPLTPPSTLITSVVMMASGGNFRCRFLLGGIVEKALSLWVSCFYCLSVAGSAVDEWCGCFFS
uniref:Uncharacterized protein n=1 Tax=Oryza nivara TaxID=4536 RepID=A0A0E0HBJ4_ORYNI